MKSIFKFASLVLALTGAGAHAAVVKFKCTEAFNTSHSIVLALTGDLDTHIGTVKTEYISHTSYFDAVGVELLWSFKDGHTFFEFHRGTSGLTKMYEFVDGGPESIKASAMYHCDKD